MIPRYMIHDFDREDLMLAFINNMDSDLHVVCFLPSTTHTYKVLVEHRIL